MNNWIFLMRYRPGSVLHKKPSPPPPITTLAWHSDGSFEINPPSTMFIIILDLPEVDGETTGGDTIFTDQVQAYNRLSPKVQKFLEGLYAVHSFFERSVNAIEAGGYLYREPVAVVHPVVRVHPVTGAKAIFVNETYTRHIVGFTKEESDMILGFLYNLTAKSADMQVRVKWEKGTVIVWDNGFTSHTGMTDFEGTHRHIVRVGPRGEQPIPVQGP
jgi:sulfonate dioxygenase